MTAAIVILFGLASVNSLAAPKDKNKDDNRGSAITKTGGGGMSRPCNNKIALNMLSLSSAVASVVSAAAQNTLNSATAVATVNTASQTTTTTTYSYTDVKVTW